MIDGPIEKLYAWCDVNVATGTELIICASSADSDDPIPFVADELVMLEELRPAIVAGAEAMGRAARLVEFQRVRVVDDVMPLVLEVPSWARS